MQINRLLNFWALRFGLIVGLCLVWLPSFAEPQNIHQFDIPEMPLNNALNSVSDISDVSFLVDFALIDRVTSKGIKGEYTTQQALNLLLAGTGLKGEIAKHNIFLIKPFEITPAINTQTKDIVSTPSNLFKKSTSFLFSGTRRAKAEEELVSTESNVERISVTGSYIKRKSYNGEGSPIEVLDRNTLDADAINGRIIDSVRFLPINNGNFSALSPGGDDGAQEGRLGAGTLDMRGLGGGATLVLVNGQRQANFPLALDRRVDINSLSPSIMLNSVEILKGGASAVYGSDAVAGVANFITRSDFEGVELRIDGRGTLGATKDPFDHYNATVGVLFGTSASNPFHIVAGFEYFNQDNLVFGEVEQVPVFTSQGASSFGNPGSYVVPIRDDMGSIIGSETLADPFCQDVIDANITRDPNFSTTATSLDSDAGLCRITFPNQAFLLDETRWSSRIETQWRIRDSFNIKGVLGFNRTIAKDIFNATAPVINFPIVPGEHPNNPFTAFTQSGSQLFAQDQNNDGIADRDATGSVILDDNGIAFSEDVLFRGRPFSATNLGVVSAKQEVNTLRTGLTINGVLDHWYWTLGWNHSKQELTRTAPDSVFSELQNALNGEGGPNRELYFNPFGSAILNQEEENDPSLVDSIKVLLVDQHQSEVSTLDGVISGELFDLQGGPLSVAFGFQIRKDTLVQDFDELKNIGQVSFFGNGDVDFSASESVTAIFFETAVPVLDNISRKLDLSVAGRYEKNTKIGSFTFNPKFSMNYRTDLFSLNASYATSFLAPSLFQLEGTTAQFANVDDPTSGTSEQVSTRIIGNRNLKDQESVSTSFGVGFTPNSRLVTDLTYWRFNFDDLIAASLAQTIVSADPFGPLVTRDESNIISLVERPFFNGGAIDTDGVDFKMSYTYPTTNLGEFELQAQGTFVSHYDVQDQVDGPVVDGVGSDNNGNIGTAIAEWRSNVRLLWLKGGQSGIVTARYYSDVERRRGSAQGIAKATWVIDAEYNYTINTPIYDAVLTLGARNLLNNEPNIVLTTDNQYFVGNFQDPAGRVLYARIKLNF